MASEEAMSQERCRGDQLWPAIMLKASKEDQGIVPVAKELRCNPSKEEDLRQRGCAGAAQSPTDSSLVLQSLSPASQNIHETRNQGKEPPITTEVNPFTPTLSATWNG